MLELGKCIKSFTK